MPITRKVLIRVIGAPLLLGALGLLFWVDYSSYDPALRLNLLGIRWLIAVIAPLCFWEFCGLCGKKGIATARVVGVIALAFTLAPLPWLMNAVGLPGIAVRLPPLQSLTPYALGLYVALKVVIRHGSFGVEGAALTLAGYSYAWLLGLVVVGPVSWPAAWYYVLFLLAANKAADMAAYVVGKSIGKHKMTPVLSPNKTWEGGIGGVIGGSAAAAAVLLATPLREAYAAVPVATLLLFAVSVTIAAQAGDLVESAIKRWAGAKDSGGLLPEFGGFLDMADGFLISAPVAWLLHVLVLL